MLTSIPIANARIILSLAFSILLAGFLSSCKKEEEMVLDRVIAPILITASGGSFTATDTVLLTAQVLELDKSGLLNYQVGIDSIPVSNLSMSLLVAGGAKVADLSTNAQGVISTTKTWAQLGLAAPKKGNTVTLEWVGQYKGQAFVKQTKVQVK